MEQMSHQDAILIPLALPQFVRAEQQSPRSDRSLQRTTSATQSSSARWSGRLNPPTPIGTAASIQTTTSTVSASGYDVHHPERQPSIHQHRVKALLSASANRAVSYDIPLSSTDRTALPSTDGM